MDNVTIIVTRCKIIFISTTNFGHPGRTLP